MRRGHLVRLCSAVLSVICYALFLSYYALPLRHWPTSSVKSRAFMSMQAFTLQSMFIVKTNELYRQHRREEDISNRAI